MNFLIAANTDKGIKKATNEDSLAVKRLTTSLGKMVFAVLCDGMGGLSVGEIASATLVKAFSDWANFELPALCENALEDHVIRASWEHIVASVNQKLAKYGESKGLKLGTTVTAILLTEHRYYIVNVGDTRAYAIADSVVQLTKDQTVIARELELGKLTPEQAKTDPRRSVLLQCVGASQEVRPDLFFGATNPNAVYMLCTDGFRHEITQDEIFDSLNPMRMRNTNQMKANLDYLVQQNKLRQETDNISVIAIKTISA